MVAYELKPNNTRNQILKTVFIEDTKVESGSASWKNYKVVMMDSLTGWRYEIF
jgi:hypothetical protein